MAIQVEDFEGGADGVVVDLTNTTGFTGLNTDPNFTFSTLRSVSGSKSAHFNNVASAARLFYSPPFTMVVYRRVYLYVVSSTLVAFMTTQGGGVQQSSLQITAGQVINLRDLTTTVASTTALATNAWHRIEWKIDYGAALQTLRVYSGASLHLNDVTPTQEVSGAITTTVEWDRFYIGIGAASAAEYFMDAYADSQENWLGSAVDQAINGRYLLQDGSGYYQLEDGSGVLASEDYVPATPTGDYSKFFLVM